MDALYNEDGTCDICGVKVETNNKIKHYEWHYPRLTDVGDRVPRDEGIRLD